MQGDIFADLCVRVYLRYTKSKARISLRESRAELLQFESSSSSSWCTQAERRMRRGGEHTLAVIVFL